MNENGDDIKLSAVNINPIVWIKALRINLYRKSDFKVNILKYMLKIYAKNKKTN